MNLESDKRLIQLRLDFSSAPTGEARQARREDIDSLSVVSEPERPTNTFCLERVSATSRTAVYGPVRTVVWEGRSREAPPYPDHWHIASFRCAAEFGRYRGIADMAGLRAMPSPRPFRTTVWPIGWPCSHNFRSKAQTLASPQQRRLRIAARMGEPPTTMHGYELFQPPRYARLTSGMRASSAPVPESLTRPFSST